MLARTKPRSRNAASSWSTTSPGSFRPACRSAADLAIDFNRNISAEAEGAKLIARLNAPENWQERARRSLPLAEVAAKAAAQTESLNRLRMISLAIHNYHDAHVQLPPAATRDDGKPLLSWRVALLPYIGEDELYNEFHLDEPWDSEHNKALIERMPAIYGTSPTLDPGHTTILAVSGPDAMFGPEMGVKLHDVRDGLSNTVMIVIAAESKAVPWTKPSDLDPAAEDPPTPSDWPAKTTSWPPSATVGPPPPEVDRPANPAAVHAQRRRSGRTAVTAESNRRRGGRLAPGPPDNATASECRCTRPSSNAAAEVLASSAAFSILS